MILGQGVGDAHSSDGGTYLALDGEGEGAAGAGFGF